jgi:hypothetical protein
MDLRKERAINLFELILCTLIMLGMTVLINRTNNGVLAQRQAFQNSSGGFLPQGKLCDKDEERISNLFVEDTLPRLIQFGLVKKYELTQWQTVLYVNGNMWKQRSQYFKNCLLTEILVHNRINGYSPKTQIIDNHSRRLFAKISPPSTFTFFD